MDSNGGWDVRISTLNFSSGYIEIWSDDMVSIATTDVGMRIRFTVDGDNMLVVVMDPALNVLGGMYFSYPAADREAWGLDFRILVHDTFVTIYRDGNACIGTIGLSSIAFALDPGLIFINASGGALSYCQITVHELDDWREAIWMDVENDVQNAIGNVIQERPVEFVGKQDGSIAFFYFPFERPSVTISSDWLESHKVSHQMSRNVCSDAVVYGMDTGMTVDENAAKEFGLITRVHRMPNMESGYMKASRILQLKARQSIEQHSVSARFYPTLEVGDMLAITYVMPGLGATVTEQVIVESLQVSIAPGARMSITGRSNSTTYSSVLR